MSNIVLIHGYGATPELYWFPWLTEELEKRGHTVIRPILPHQFRPHAQAWIETLQSAIDPLDADTVFVAHSLGNAALVQYLQHSALNKKYRAYIAVAPLLLERYGDLFPTFFEHAIDSALLRSHVQTITVLHDPLDRWAPFSNARFLHGTCGARLIECPGRHHFNHLNRSDPIPEILDAVLAVLE